MILSEDTNILEFNQYQKYDNALFFINAEPECLIGKIDGFKYNPKKSSTTKAGVNIFYQVFRCLQYHNFKVSKINVMFTEIKIA